MKVFYLLHPRLRFLSHLSWDGKETLWIPSPAVMAMTGLTILPWLMRVFRVVEVGGFASSKECLSWFAKTLSQPPQLYSTKPPSIKQPTHVRVAACRYLTSDLALRTWSCSKRRCLSW